VNDRGIARFRARRIIKTMGDLRRDDGSRRGADILRSASAVVDTYREKNVSSGNLNMTEAPIWSISVLMA
jgi:hypothetical protein